MATWIVRGDESRRRSRWRRGNSVQTGARLRYLDKLADPPADKTEARSAIVVSEEYDRVYKGTNDPVLVDSAKGKKLVIDNKRGWKDTVLWSPWARRVAVEGRFTGRGDAAAAWKLRGSATVAPRP